MDPAEVEIDLAPSGTALDVDTRDTQVARDEENATEFRNGRGPRSRKNRANDIQADEVVEATETVEAVVGIGRRVVILANLGLAPISSPSSEQAALGIANALDSWQGPGTVVLAGNFLDLRCGRSEAAKELGLTGVAEIAEKALKTHSRLTEALRDIRFGTATATLVPAGHQRRRYRNRRIGKGFPRAPWSRGGPHRRSPLRDGRWRKTGEGPLWRQSGRDRWQRQRRWQRQ